MDHKVSKDMISSGMIPSGEKTQADLGRTQYGSAPSPSKLMDAYHSMYQDQKEQTLDEKINPLNFGKSPRTLQQKRAARKTTQIVKGDASADIPTGENNPKASSLANTMRGQGAGAKQKLDKTETKKQKKDTQSKGFGESSADLLAAYHAVYEHHKKDEDGNTIPHDGDTISEDLFNALKSALIEGGCDEKNVMKIMASVTPDYFDEIIQEENIDEAIVTGSVLAGLAAKKLLAGAIAKKVGAVALKKGIGAAAKTGARLGSKYIAQKGGKMAAAKAVTGEVGKGIMSAGKSAGKAMVKNPVNTALAGSMIMPQKPPSEVAQRGVASGKRTAGVQRMDLDLFDVVKGQLLDEGLTEEEVLDVMTTLTLDEINEGLMPTTLKGALVRGAAVSGGLLAARQVGKKAKEKVDDALNKARDNSPIGGNTRPGSDKIYFGK